MAQGNSGRVVIDIDPELKKRIYQQLRSRGVNMREWFLTMAEQELTAENEQQNTKRYADIG